MCRQRLTYSRFGSVILLAVTCALPLVVYGAIRGMCGTNNSVRQWLQKDSVEAREYDWFVKHFGSEEMVIVSWPGCTVDDERLDRLAEGLSAWTATADVGDGHEGQAALVDRVITGRQLLSDLMVELDLSKKDALRRLQGYLIGPDGRATALVALVSEEGASNREAVVDTIYRVAEAAAGLSPENLRLAGPTVQSVALVQESRRSRVTLSSIAVALVALLAWWCLKSVRLALIVVATAMLCGTTSVAVLYYTGGHMNMVMVMMPVLVFVLAISAAIHLANYYREAISEGGSRGAVERAMISGWLPCVLSAFTTAVGLASLAVSDLTPVKMFGIYSALGVLCSVVVLLLFLPAALTIWPAPPSQGRAGRRLPARIHGTQGRSCWAASLAAGVSRYNLWIISLIAAAVVLTASGLPRLSTSVKLLNLFSPKTRFIEDVAWLEEHLGPVVPIEVVVRFGRDNPHTMLERLELVRSVQTRMNEVDEVGGTMSVATFAPSVPRGRGFRQTMRRSAVKTKLEHLREHFADARYLSTAEGEEFWRVSARVEALNSIDYAEFTHQLRQKVEPVIDSFNQQRGCDVKTTYTGLVPLFYKAQRVLLADMISSLRVSFALIAIVMVVMLRSVLAGIISMPANIFPTLVVFGGMGWTGQLCDIGSMMTASVALGIAVDDTIHFLSCFRRGMRRGRSRKEAIQLAYKRCAGAMLQTTAICGLGLFAYAFSSFTPTSQFAWLMCTLLVAALAGDLLLLPAILAGPLGRVFERDRTAASRLTCKLSSVSSAVLVELPKRLSKVWSTPISVQQSA